jgi:hypothetical protein
MIDAQAVVGSLRLDRLRQNRISDKPLRGHFISEITGLL